MDSSSTEPLYLFNTGPEKMTVSAADLERILSEGDEELKQLPIVPIVVVGRVQKGKSLLVNGFKRYYECDQAEDWFSGSDQKLTGFVSQRSCVGVSEGIRIWPKPFKVNLSENQKVAVLIIDTQGLYDSDTTEEDDACIFAMSALLSSVLIYNTADRIQEDDLRSLQVCIEFTKYLRSASQDNDQSGGGHGETSKMFSNLILLVRDWIYPEDCPYGWSKEMIDREISRQTNREDLVAIRKGIRDAFEYVDAYVMPRPGDRVHDAQDFDGRIGDIAAKEEFAKHFKAFIEQLLCRDGLCLRPLSLEEFCRKTEACAIALRASEANHASVIAAGKATLAALNSLIVKSSIDAYNQLRDSDRARRRNIRNFERMTTIAGITLAAGVLVYTIYHIL